MTASLYLKHLQYVLLAALLAAGCGGKGKDEVAADPAVEEKIEKVPAAAELLGNHRGNVAQFIAFPGTLYVVDGKTNRIIYEGPVDRGQKVILYAEAGRLVVNGAIVPEVQIDPERNYKFYLLRG